MGMTIFLNGKKEELDPGLDLMQLLQKKNIRPEVVTVELNGQIVDRHNYAQTRMKEADKVEFVYFMGGGYRRTTQNVTRNYAIQVVRGSAYSSA